MKHVLVLFSIILTLIPVVKAEDKSWYEIDGIRVRYAINRNTQLIYMPWKIESQITPFGISPNIGLIAGKAEPKNLFPLALELPETLMTSWSFRGALFEFEFPSEVKDLGPDFGGDHGRAYRRQSSKISPSL